MSTRLRPLLWRYRFLVAGLCVAWAVVLVVAELRPPAPVTTDVVVAARDLPAGTVLAAADVSVQGVRDPPGGTVPLTDALGATLAIGVPAGLPIAGSLLVGPGLLEHAPPGSAVLTVRLADPAMADLVRVGDRLDLYLAPVDAGGQLLESELVAAGALVLSREDAAPESATLFGPGTAGDASSFVVAVASHDAARVSGASAIAPFRATFGTG